MISAFLKKLMFARQFDMGDGTILILGNEHIMLGSEILYMLQEKNPQEFFESIRESTRELTKHYFEKLGASQVRSNFTVEGIFNDFGLGKIEVVELGETRAVINLFNSAIARQYLKLNPETDHGVCNLTAAVLAGMFSFILKTDVMCEEHDCIAKGNDKCKFILMYENNSSR
ncbi:4-vinyl reductase [Candidatus Woesearchaeota archaeon]|nr:4-vinyl reductase [Candidatus Woesearchaeota archaeon]